MDALGGASSPSPCAVHRCCTAARPDPARSRLEPPAWHTRWARLSHGPARARASRSATMVVRLRRGRKGDMQQPRRTALRFDYVPPLDGLRALAVLGVMAYHGGLAFVPGGFFGVDVFFVLSGFLSTSLQLRLDALSALFYVANWHFVLAGQDYFVQTGAVSPLLHTWSLAIEEQFYMVWPLVVAGVLALGRRRRGDGRVGLWVLFGLSVAGALASAAEMALVYRRGAGVTRVYFGTDTHAQSLLVGTALALGVVLWRQRADREASDRPPVARTPLGRAMLGAVGVAGAGAAGWAWAGLHDGDPAVFRGGILLV